MAQKRMFSLNIVDSDAFLDMPVSSQLLYFHIAMRADDEGFVGNPKKVLRFIGASEDDLKVLIAKRFLIAFESGVVVIKHWLMHNTIRMDRFGGTTYTEERALLTVKSNKAYTLVIGDEMELATSRQPSGNQLATQVKLSKDNISKPSTRSDDEYDPQFLKFWDGYPKKVGKGEAANAWRKLKPSQQLAERIVASVKAHQNDEQWKRERGRFIPNPATYLNQRRFDDELKAVEETLTTVKAEPVKKLTPEQEERRKEALARVRQGLLEKRIIH